MLIMLKLNKIKFHPSIYIHPTFWQISGKWRPNQSKSSPYPTIKSSQTRPQNLRSISTGRSGLRTRTAVSMRLGFSPSSSLMNFLRVWPVSCMSSTISRLFPAQSYPRSSPSTRISPVELSPEQDFNRTKSLRWGWAISFTRSAQNIKAPLRTQMTTRSRLPSVALTWSQQELTSLAMREMTPLMVCWSQRRQKEIPLCVFVDINYPINTIMGGALIIILFMIRRVGKFCISYESAFKNALVDPIAYWRGQAERVQWHAFPKTTLAVEDLHFYKWFPDGRINITEQCLDVHLAHRPHQVAYFVESPITGSRSTITYQQLHARVEAFAGALKSEFGVGVGDRVIIYMPMVIQSIIAILACARIGATHVVVFGGFSAHELANRIVDCNPKAVILANAGKQPNKVLNYKSIVNHALELSGKKQLQKIIFQRPDLLAPEPLQANQHDFLKAEKSGARTSPIYVNSDHPLYILYTSGTTGKPKGIVRDHGGTAVLLQHAMRRIYNIKAGGSMFCSSDIGWVLGHSFIIYAPLITGIKSVLFEGKPVGTPDPDVFWQIIDRNKIEHLYTSPTAIRTIRKEDSEGRYINQHNLNHLKSVTLVGERCDIPTFQWVEDHLKGKLVNDCYWQTETGGPILSNYLGFETFPEKPGSACKPLPGYNVKVINSATGVECKANETGTIYVKEPLPPSFMKTILNNDDVYVKKYFSTLVGHYNTGDSGYFDTDGYFHIMAREDDVINTAGHRLSTGEMEEILMKHSKIAEAIVIGAHDDIKGEVPVAFVTIKTEHVASHCPKTVAEESVKLIREHIGPVASFKICHVVPRLPKTRSGKYLRHIVRKMCNKQKYEVPSTIEDMDVAHEMHSFVEKHHRH